MTFKFSSLAQMNYSLANNETEYFDTLNPPKIELNLPETTGPVAKFILPELTDSPVKLEADEVAIYYAVNSDIAEADESFHHYSLHIWNDPKGDRADDSMVNGAWENTQNTPTGIDSLGPYWKVKIKPGSTDCLHFIVRNGSLDNLLGGDAKLNLKEIPHRKAYYVSGNTKAIQTRKSAFLAVSQVRNASAHLIDADTLVWQGGHDADEVRLYVSLEGGIEPNDSYQYDGQYIVLKPTILTAKQEAKFPYLLGKTAFKIDSDINIRSLVKTAMLALAVDKNGIVLAGTKVQPAGVLDELFAPNAEDVHLGAQVLAGRVQFNVWAPTAQNVALMLFDDQKNEFAQLQMAFDEQSGVWSLFTDKAKDGTFYRYLIDVYHPDSDKIEHYQVTDPYSLSLSMNSAFSQVVDLNDPYLKPQGWDQLQRPIDQSNPAKFVIYEAHVRDFSSLDESTNPDYRGKFKAFTQSDSVPVKHLKKLSDNGVTHLHLLPIADIATINENPEQVADIDQPFSRLCEVNEEAAHSIFKADCHSGLTIAQVLERETEHDSVDCPRVQELNRLIAETDSFNWGYDPFHYIVPEGSYSTQPDGKQRIYELREMILAVKQDIKMNIVMDVVYNHTYSSGPDSDTSVLDKIVPWYYHRLNPETGAVENSTCCSNTAPEHDMMAKLIKDSLVVWARDYKIDSFRFDLMGHHPLSQIKDALEAVQVYNPDVYFYGEGWNFGEVANDNRFVQATQFNLAGTGIGSFSDRLRNAVRGGGPFDEKNALRHYQGFGNGAYVQPNEVGRTDRETALHLADVIRLGMAGNLKDFQFVDFTGRHIRGYELIYNGQPAGYAKDPIEIQNYVSKHDNQTLWDMQQYKIGYGTDINTRVRMQAVSLSTVMLGQAVPFIHMGSELLRSKSMQRDSYNSGDWYNRVDFTLQDNNWDKGLPCKDKNASNYQIIDEVVKSIDDNAVPSSEDMAKMLSYYLDLAKLRQTHPLLSLGTGTEVMKRVAFHNVGPDQQPSLIVMSIDNGNTVTDLDPTLDCLLVLINASPEVREIDLGVSDLELSPVYRSDLAQGTLIEGTKIIVPPWTPAVLVKPRLEQRSLGLPVNR